MKKFLCIILAIVMSQALALSQTQEDNPAVKRGVPLYKIVVGENGKVTEVHRLPAGGGVQTDAVTTGEQNSASRLMNKPAADPSAAMRARPTIDINQSLNRNPAAVKGKREPLLIENSSRRIVERMPAAPDMSTQQNKTGSLVPAMSSAPTGTESWTTIMSETFEGSFPGTGWSCYAGSGYTNAYWDDVSTRPYSGSWSAWCAAGGTSPGSSSTYRSYMQAWAEYGPFSMSDAVDGSLHFHYWNDSESYFDYFGWYVSVDGVNYYGSYVSGSSGGWVAADVDLKNVPTLGNVMGYAQVWIAFVFESDGSIQYEGTYIDDILLQKNTGTLPDLTWTSMALTATDWPVGNSITATLTEINQGAGTAGAHQTQLYLSTTADISTSDTPLGSALSYTAMNAGTTQDQSRTFTVPNVTGGTYYVGAIVDINNSVTESNESNNTGYRNGTVNVIPNGPDLYWTSLALNTDSWVATQTSVTATLTEMNGGNQSAGAHQTRLYLSSDSYINSSDVLLTTLSFASIAASGTQSQSGTFTAPNVSAGSYYMGAMVDYNNAVAETDETNNTDYRIGLITVTPPATPPDLEWITLSFTSETWIVGGSITGTLTETNNGSTSGGAHQSQLYLSSDATVTSSDVALGTPISFTTIAGGATQSQSKTFTVPDVPDGTYYAGALVDINNSVTESDETNNDGARIGMITVSHQGSASVTGTVKYNNSSQTPVANVTVTLGSQTATSSTSGGYSFSTVSAGTYNLRGSKSGGWFGVNSTDALLIARHFVALQSITDTLLVRAADVNLDGNVNSTDALLVLRRSIGLDQSFTAGDWIFTRPSVTVSASAVSKDLYGVYVGDVNASNVPSNGSYFPKVAAGTNLRLEVEGRNAVTRGGVAEISIRARGEIEMGALQMCLIYPANMGTYLGMSSTLSGMVSRGGDGEVNLAWCSMNGVGQKFYAGDEIARLRYEMENVDGIFRIDVDGGEVADGFAIPLSAVVFSTQEIEVGNTPGAFNLDQNYPNPFNPATTIHYSVGEPGRVRLLIYDILGRLVATLVDEEKTTGDYSIVWDAKTMSSGTYVCKMIVEYNGQLFRANKSLILLK